MPRDRQQAKRRQAERREARLRERGGATGGDGAPRDRAPVDRAAAGDGGAAPAARGRDPAAGALDPAAEARIAAAAPPQTAGRSDTVVEAPPPAPELETDDQATAPPRDRTLPAEPGERRRGRVVAFLVAVWAELQRVQWPDRKTLTTLTGVVLGFVLVAGGYLGGLDAIISRLMQAIL